MYKILFTDIKDYDVDFFQQNMIKDCEYILESKPFHLVEQEKYTDIDILSVFTSSDVKEENLSKFPSLKLVTTRSTGFSHIDLDYCKSKGIIVCNVPRYGDCTVAEYTFALLLNVARKVNIAYEQLKDGIIDLPSGMGVDLFGKTIGIIGTGSIGRHVIKIANGFSMNILAYDIYPKQELVDKYDVKYVDIDTLYSNSDIISIHAPSTKENYHMINDAAFEKMKKGVIFINTARGEIADTFALNKALKNGIVAAAGLDVLECEDALANEGIYLEKADCIKPDCLQRTLINNLFLKMPNVIVTPHLAFNTKEALERIHKTSLQNIQCFIENNVENKVN